MAQCTKRRILQSIISCIHRILGLGTRLRGPSVYVVSGALIRCLVSFSSTSSTDTALTHFMHCPRRVLHDSPKTVLPRGSTYPQYKHLSPKVPGLFYMEVCFNMCPIAILEGREDGLVLRFDVLALRSVVCERCAANFPKGLGTPVQGIYPKPKFFFQIYQPKFLLLGTRNT